MGSKFSSNRNSVSSSATAMTHTSTSTQSAAPAAAPSITTVLPEVQVTQVPTISLAEPPIPVQQDVTFEEAISLFFNPTAPIPQEASIMNAFSHLSLVHTDSGTPVYTLSVTDQHVCVFVPSLQKFIRVSRSEISLVDIKEGLVYHVPSVERGQLGQLSVPSASARQMYLERRASVCDSATTYRKMILPALLLGSRVRDFEQGCATVDQLSELKLTMPVPRGNLQTLTLRTISGQRFKIGVKKVEKNDMDKVCTVTCHEPSRPLPSDVRKGCLLEIVGGANTEEPRVTAALMGVHANSKTPINNWSLLSAIYGQPRHLVLPAVSPQIPVIKLAKNAGVVSLNAAQAEAVARYTSDACPAFVVEAPPGSGKTMTAAAMAVSYEGYGVQLFLSTANVPVSNMAHALANLDYGSLRALHLTSAECEGKMTDETRSPFCSLSLAKAQNALSEKISRLEQELTHAPNEEERKKLKGEIRNLCGSMLDATYDVYFATVDMILGRLFKQNKDGRHNHDVIKKRLMTSVRRIVIDEASQLTEAALNAIILCFHQAQIALIGDSNQLDPFKYKRGDIVSELSARPALEAFKDKMNLPVIKLTRVYRASPSLIAHYSNVFYGGRLESKQVSRGENPLENLDRTIKGSRCVFWKVEKGRTEQSGTSKINWGEIRSLKFIIDRLKSKGHDERSVMIISYYEAQRKKVEEQLKGYEVLTVDSAQGREKPIVIVLTTRTSVPEEGDVFFTSPKRLNVAVSRQKEALIVIGHPSIQHAPNWVDVLSTKYFRHVDDRA